MCTGLELAMLAAAAVGTYSTLQSAEQQSKWNDYQSAQAQADAKAEQSAAEVQADKIRKLARRQAGEATASIAGSGVDVGEGTALNINKDIYANSEEDAVMTIFGGADRYARGNAEAAGYRIKGEQAQQAGYLNATSSLLSAAGSYGRASGWKTSKNASVPAYGGKG